MSPVCFLTMQLLDLETMLARSAMFLSFLSVLESVVQSNLFLVGHLQSKGGSVPPSDTIFPSLRADSCSAELGRPPFWPWP